LHALRTALDDHHGAPYDRQRTTMASFAMCPIAKRNTTILPIGDFTPADRMSSVRPAGCGSWARRECQSSLMNPLASFAEALARGRIGALKGWRLPLGVRCAHFGGSRELRRRKYRHENRWPHGPRLGRAEALCEIGAAERELLISAVVRSFSTAADFDSVAADVARQCIAGHHVALYTASSPA